MENGSYWLDKARTSIWRDVRTLAIEEAYTTKYSIHPGADTMLCGFRLTNRWLSMKKDIASCGSKYLAYSEEEVEYQGSSGLLLQPESHLGEFGGEFLDDERVLMPRVVKSRDEIFSRWGYCDNHDLSRLDNQSIECGRLIGIGFVLNFVKFISFTFGDKEMISVIEAIIREVFVKLLLKSSGKLSIRHGLYVTIVCYVLLAIVVDRGTRSVPLFVVLERDRLKALMDLTNNVNNANGGNGGGGNGNGGNNGCTFKAFQSCNPKEYDGKGGAIVLTHWIKKMENVIDNSGCAENQKVRYATSSLVNKDLTWWNTQVQARGREAAMAMSWNDFKALMVEEFCPSNEMEKLESGFWNHKMVGANHAAYTDRFHELAKLVPHLVTPESSHIKRYIAGLAPEIRGMHRATQPTIIQNAILREWRSLVRLEDLGKDNKKANTGTGFVATAPTRNEAELPWRNVVGSLSRVHGERAVGITKALKSAKEDELRFSNISVVREFEDVFPEDLSGLAP
ncbi:reverse transcriptase domain-containing protein [Tanacetum coccineum]